MTEKSTQQSESEQPPELTSELTDAEAKQIRENSILLAKARGLTNAATAVEAGCSVSTVCREVAKPDFWPRVHKLRDLAIRDAAGRLSVTSMNAIESLETLLKSESHSIVLGAAGRILDQAVKFRGHLVLEAELAKTNERLAQMEALVAELTKGH